MKICGANAKIAISRNRIPIRNVVRNRRRRSPALMKKRRQKIDHRPLLRAVAFWSGAPGATVALSTIHHLVVGFIVTHADRPSVIILFIIKVFKLFTKLPRRARNNLNQKITNRGDHNRQQEMPQKSERRPAAKHAANNAGQQINYNQNQMHRFATRIPVIARLRVLHAVFSS
jgi:hypothetical protein